MQAGLRQPPRKRRPLPPEEGGCPCNIAMVPSAADVWDDALCVRFADRDARPAVVLKSANELNVLNIGVGHRDLNPFCSFVHSARLAGTLALVRLEGRQLTLSSAGMPPALLYRAADKRLEEIALQGMPLGSLDFNYRETRLEVAPGDAILLMSDGFPELPNGAGDPLGYERVNEIFAGAATQAPEELIATLSRAATEWGGEGSPNDDITFVALRVRER